MSLIKEERIYFHGLDELRAVAAILVFFHHVELFKLTEKIPSLCTNSIFSVFAMKIGHKAVVAFFVLSGFLITYLLLKEKEKTGTINIRAFYLRRIFRIWPLYFLIVLIGYIIMPLLDKTDLFTSSTYFTKLIERLSITSLPFFLLFMSNFVLYFFSPIAGASQSWSVSLEEQFYLIWPNLIKRVKSKKHTLILIVSLVILKLIIQWLLYRIYQKNIVLDLLELFCIEYMFIGAISAIVYSKFKDNSRVMSFFVNRFSFLLLISIIFIEMFCFNHFVFISILIAILIIFLISFKIRFKLLNYFGKISYGIYMFHPFVLYITLPMFINIKNQFLFNFLLYGVTFGLTIVISSISFKFFEQPILKFKNKYTIIKSGI